MILITSSEISSELNKALFNCIARYKVEVKKAPVLNTFTNFYSKTSLKDISIEDLLGRNPIEPNPTLLDKNIKNKITLVTGAGGSIGSELCHNILKRCPRKLILIETSEFNLYKIEQRLNDYKIEKKLNVEILPILGSIQDRFVLERIFSTLNIDTIFMRLHTNMYH